MGDLFGGGGGSGAQGFDVTGGGSPLAFNYGPTPFDIAQVHDATGTNLQAIINRYNQLGLGGATETSPPPTSSPAPSASHPAGGVSHLALLVQALGGNLTPLASIPAFHNLFFGTPGPQPSAPASNAPASQPTFTGGSTMEQEDLAAAEQAGQATIGQEQTSTVLNPAINPALQPPINQLIGVNSQTGGQTASTLGTLAGAAAALPFAFAGA